MTWQRGGDRPPQRGGGTLSYPKAIGLVVAALALGIYLLSLGNGRSSGSAKPPTTSSTTTTTAPTSTTTTRPAGSRSVEVLVANASETNGVATYYTKELTGDGWGTLTPVTALTVETTSAVYYATGQQTAATSIASELGIAPTRVHVLGSTTPVASAALADVVVIIGEDLAAKATPAS